MSLGKVSFDPKHLAGFGSVAKLAKTSKFKKGMLKSGCRVGTRALYTGRLEKIPANPYTVTNIDVVWEMYLADLSSISKYNDKYKYLLNVIGIFSRYAWSVPLKDKTGTSITSALKYLFQNRKSITIQSDKGTEFVNAAVQQYLKRQGINFHTTHNPDIKSAIIERFNKSLNAGMFKYFTKNNTYRYLNVINKLLTG